jgi:hypothetical protein
MSTDPAPRRKRGEKVAMAGLDAPTTMCEAFQATVARYPQQVALRTPGGGG